jgi:hypothetical protein
LKLERGREAGAREGLGREACVLEEGDELEIEREGVGVELLTLGFEADPLARLLLGRDADVSDDASLRGGGREGVGHRSVRADTETSVIVYTVRRKGGSAALEGK